MSRSVPRWAFTNVRIGQGKRLLCHLTHCDVICTEWTFGNGRRDPKDGDTSEGEDFREVLDVRIRDSSGGSGEMG